MLGPGLLVAATGIGAGDLADARQFTTRAIADLRASDEGKDGLSAFLEKRKPRWA